MSIPSKVTVEIRRREILTYKSGSGISRIQWSRIQWRLVTKDTSGACCGENRPDYTDICDITWDQAVALHVCGAIESYDVAQELKRLGISNVRIKMPRRTIRARAQRSSSPHSDTRRA